MVYKTDLSSFNNKWFKTGASKPKRILWYYVNLIFFLSPIFPSYKLKVRLLRMFGATIGDGVLIKPSVNIKYPWKLIIYNNVWIGENAWIDNLALVTIGNNVCISQGAMLLCGNHNYKKSTFDLLTGAITIEEGAWIGAKAIVSPGVKCFSHSILTVGSVAVKNLEPFSIYQGNPAVKVRDRVLIS
ncbi:MAG: colanic acid biosynthesis acetyltransferase WcaF [Bacteroidetes bacterium]|nr:colanic acid biosynthesis acetyltransferase WcaF [Bacteroidota bacterium]HET6243369.1 WcaF family extracellular polysaccharide biosynthesis acetyltransferase [Bacteroidia bacterium]